MYLLSDKNINMEQNQIYYPLTAHKITYKHGPSSEVDRTVFIPIE